MRSVVVHNYFPKRTRDTEEHLLSVSLQNEQGLRLTRQVYVIGEKSVRMELLARRQAKTMVNADPEQRKSGPWRVVSSGWQR